MKKIQKRCLAIILAMTMIFCLSGIDHIPLAKAGTTGTIETRTDDNQNTYTYMAGSDGWDNAARGTEYDFPSGTSKTFTVIPESNYITICAEFIGQESSTQNYYTAELGFWDPTTWTSVNNVPVNYTPDPINDRWLNQWQVYEITVSRTDTNYAVRFYNQTLQHECYSIALDIPKIQSDVIFHFIELTDYNHGTKGVRVYEGNAAKNGFIQGKTYDGKEASEYESQAKAYGVETVPDEMTNHGKDRTREAGAKTSEQEKAMLPDPSTYDVANLPTQGKAKNGTYADYFLKEDLQTVKIEVDKESLDYLLQNAYTWNEAGLRDKPTILAKSATIGGQKVEYVGLKTKGNYTLGGTKDWSSSDHYSFTLNFGKYIKKGNGYNDKQNFFGCPKISFNNCYFDKTFMKEYCAWKLMKEMGVPTPEFGLAKLYINDEYYGVYFMLQSMDTSILKNWLHSGKVSDYIVKPPYSTVSYDWELMEPFTENGLFTLNSLSNRTYDAGGQLVDNGKNTDDCLFYMDESGKWKSDRNVPHGYWDEGKYVISNPYRNIAGLWECSNSTLDDVAEMMPTVFDWEKKLQQLSDGINYKTGESVSVNSETYLELLNEIIDVDAAVRYFAVHSFLVQTDDIFNGAQNYGLYVGEDGKAVYMPWDYDIAWGGFDPFEAESTMNFPRDCMYEYNKEDGSYDNPDDRYRSIPMFYVLWQNKELRQKYYTYMDDCSKIVELGGTTTKGTTLSGTKGGETFEPGRFSEIINTLYPKVVAAASEKLASHVYYIDHNVAGNPLELEQPKALKLGIPNLKKVVVRRAVGVWLQSHSDEYNGYKVTGYGCDYFTIGSGDGLDVIDNPSTGGKLAVVDDETGIFVTAEYNQGSKGPELSSKKLTSSDSSYGTLVNQAKSVLNTDKDVDVLAYQLNDTREPKTSYTIHIPIPTGYLNAGSKLYEYNESTGELKMLPATLSGSLYTLTTDSLGTYVLVKEAAKTPQEIPAAPTDSKQEPTSQETTSATTNQTAATNNQTTAGKTTSSKKKSLKLSGVKVKRNTKKITGKVSVKGCKVSIKVGKKKYKKASVKGKKFSLKVSRLKKKTKIKIRVKKSGYKTLTKTYKVK